MESKIIKEEKNPFLERTEILLEIKKESAPSFEDIQNELKKDSNLTVVKKINSNFGRQTFVAEVFVYDNLEAKKKIEVIPKKIKKKMEAEEKAAAEAAKKAEAERKAAEEAAKAEAEKSEEPTTEETKTEEASAE